MSEHFITYEQVTTVRKKKSVRIELSACPFCGGEAEFRVGGNWNSKLGRRMGVGVRCKDCGAMTPVRQRGSCPEETAADLWNRRAQA